MDFHIKNSNIVKLNEWQQLLTKKISHHFLTPFDKKKNNNNNNNNKKPTGINPNYTTAEMNDLLKPQIQLPINMCFLSMKY